MTQSKIFIVPIKILFIHFSGEGKERKRERKEKNVRFTGLLLTFERVGGGVESSQVFLSCVVISYTIVE